MRYCAFLRGINVGGTKLKMVDLKKEFEAAGFTDVITVLATGNVIFSSATLPDLSFLPVQSFIKTEQQVREIVQNNPFQPEEDYHFYVFVAEKTFAQIAQSEFNLLNTSAEEGLVRADTFYWKVPKGMTLTTAFGKILGKKVYKDLFTSRNINTLERIIKKL
ncbi:DUF1697 domain-containing protein [Lactococcus garvieae]|uniref:DUF1697 domain-containing protein n=1 Tax=Lactococcus garvieae TaxID=1363 RepID=UPI003852BCCD